MELITGTTNRFHAFASDSSGAGVTGATLDLYINNYTTSTWFNGTSWVGGRTNVVMIADANVSGLYYYDLLLPAANNGLVLFTETVTAGVVNGPWLEEVWVEDEAGSSSTSITNISNGTASVLSPSLARYEGYLKRIEQLSNQIFQIARK